MTEVMVAPTAAQPPEQTPADDFFDGDPSATANTVQVEPQPDTQPQLTKRQQTIQTERDKWESQFPGKLYLTPEGPTLGPEDLDRLEAEAKVYGFAEFDRGSVVESYQKIQSTGSDWENGLRGKLNSDEYNGRNVQEVDDYIRQKRDEIIAQTRTKLIEQTYPYPAEAKRRERKKIDQQRNKLMAMLCKNPDEFNQLQADWDGYESIVKQSEVDSQHEAALQDDKSLKSKSERYRIKGDIVGLEEQNGGALEYLSRYDLEKDPRAAEILTDLKDRAIRHKDDSDLMDVDQLLAEHDLKWRLGEILGQTGLPDEEVKQKVEEAAPHIENWLGAITENGNDPLIDMGTYKDKVRAYESWDGRRRKAVEFLAPVVMFRSVERKFVSLAEKLRGKEPTAEEALKIVLDPSKIGERNGGHALRRLDNLNDRDAKIFAAGVRGQLSQALLLSRHEGTMMKSALLLSGFARGGAEDLSIVWDRLSPEEKAKRFKNKIAGKAAVFARLNKRLALAAAKKAKEEARYQAGFFYAREK